MISIPGSLSFAKVVMMLSTPAKSAGDTRYASQAHSFVVPYNLDSNLKVKVKVTLTLVLLIKILVTKFVI